MNEDELEFETIPSPHDPKIGAHIGVMVTHKLFNLQAKSVSERTQYANKKAAIEKLKLELVKERFLNIDQNDLLDGNTYLDNLDK